MIFASGFILYLDLKLHSLEQNFSLLEGNMMQKQGNACRARTGKGLIRTAKLATALALGLLSVPGWSMDLLQTYHLALQNDPDWQATLDQYLADQQQEKLAFGGLLPTVGASGSITRNRFDPAEPQSNELMGQPITSTSSTVRQAGVSLRQPLFRMDLWQQYQQAKVSNSLNDSRYLASQQAFTLKVAEAYFDVLRAQSLMATLNAEEAALQRQLTMMQARFKEGVVARTDVSEATAQYQNAVANRIAGENQIINAQENLTVILGQPVSTLAPLVEDFAAVAPVPNQVDSWVDLARQKNPQLAQARYQYQIAEENRKIQQSGYYPQLDLVAQTAWNKQTPETLFNNNGQSSAVGLELNLPLYRGGRTQTAVTQANYQASAARNQVDVAERQVVASVRSAFINLNTDRARIRARQDAMQSSELVAQASQAGYDLGLRTMVDVLLAQRNAFAAQQDYINARYDYVLNMLRLKQAAGQLDQEALAEINQWLDSNP
ncbi:TolC family outer membrane protein [Alkanindiges sp. WGS2144]|uniref:TolC family outer membrane protein n=1 Tax=Alkanindiges sp. WGS2144 TaxID=3366808 RepID=UPI003751332E